MLELLVGTVILLGAAGTIVPILPGVVLVGSALLVWAFVEQTTAAWITTAICLTILTVGFVLKYLIPARKVSGAVDRWALFAGTVAGLVGFFVVPVIGLFLGFVAGVFAVELAKSGSVAAAWPATKQALTAAGLSILIELGSVLVAGCVWLAAVVLY